SLIPDLLGVPVRWILVSTPSHDFLPQLIAAWSKHGALRIDKGAATRGLELGDCLQIGKGSHARCCGQGSCPVTWERSDAVNQSTPCKRRSENLRITRIQHMAKSRL
uniref:Uncharacterized protein n=1 Tax=Physcomitrium patens TaxID=3218 RepID=A0A7I4EX85_PHYPA